MHELPQLFQDKLDALAQKSQDEHDKFFGRLNTFWQIGTDAQDFLDVLTEPRFKPSSSIVRGEWADAKGYGEAQYTHMIFPDLHEILDNAFIPHLLSLIVNAKDRHSQMISAFLLTHVPAEKMTPKVYDKLKPQSGPKATVIYEANGFYNCGTSEQHVGKSLTDGKTTLVNGTLLVKGYGYKTALSLTNSSTATGTFYRGGFYTPVDEQSKQAIDTAIADRIPQITLPAGEWVYVRNTQAHNGGVLKRATKYATSLRSVDSHYSVGAMP